jgi:RNA polymerase sigma-70 factor (ECF subfamily)
MEQKEHEAFVSAYGEYEEALLRRALFKVGNPELASDLVQTTFLKTWEYLVKNGNIELMKSFLFHVLNMLIIDEYRKKKPVSLDVLIESGFEVVSDDSERHLNVIDGKSAVLLIPLLPKKYRTVISMHYLDGMSLTEISLITKQSNNTTAVQLHRGIKKLESLFLVDTSVGKGKS